jgi:catechol 2,3-dioxygenase-like lactoylglutathione lyase family enzyme
MSRGKLARVAAVVAALGVVFGGGAAAQAPQAAPAGVITGVGNFSHIVADIDRALAFYRDVIGLPVVQPPNEFSGNPAIMNLGNTPGAQSRFGTLRVPGSQLGVELIEYKDTERKPARPRFQDPGAANLILTVRDVDSIVARVKGSAGRIQTLSGTPATIQRGTRVIFLQDPDGFFVELAQPNPAPQTTASASDNVIGGGFEVMVENTDRTMRIWRDVLGFNAQVGDAFDGTKLLMDTAGTPGAEFKRSAARIPGTLVTVAFLEFRKIDRRKLDTRTQDPGTPILQLRAHDVDELTRAWKAAGGAVVSTNGEPVLLGNNKLILLRDPNGVMLELLPTAGARVRLLNR